MSSTKKGLRRVALAAVSTLVVIPAMAAIASATPTFAFDRLAGANRYETSVKIATQYGNSTSVILANGANKSFPDSLTAAYLAGEKKAPVLLTQRDMTPADVLARIAASGAKTVYLVGGEGVISAAQATALDVLYTVVRLGGLDRYLTAQAVIADAGTATSTTAVLATGVNFPDAIAGGPLSYVKGMPLAITATNTLPAATLAALKTAGTKDVIVLGGPTVVAPAVLTTLAANGITLNKRIFGANRSETSSLLAEYLITSQGFTKTGVNVASGYAFGGGADALAGGPLSGKEVRPTLITENVTNVGSTVKYLKDNCATLANGHIFGGLGAVSASAQAEMTAAGRCLTAGSNQAFTVSPVGNQTVQEGTVSQFTFSGITSSTVDIALVSCDNVSTTASGLATFPNSSNPGGAGNVANLGGANVLNDITVTNGVAGNSGQYFDNAVVTNGSVSFTVSNVDVGCYVAVVFSDANNDNKLNLGTNNQPTEAFAVSGDVTIIPVEAGSGVFGAVTVTSAGTGFFTDGTNSFFYDSNDVFQIQQGDGTYLTVSSAVFAAALSSGDILALGSFYSDVVSGVSQFKLRDIAPVSPASTATAGSTGITVAFGDATGAGNLDVANYNIYRAAAIQSSVVGVADVCPTLPSSASGSPQSAPGSAYTLIKTLADTDATTYSYTDNTVSIATAPNNVFCYAVAAVDGGGQIGFAVQSTGGAAGVVTANNTSTTAPAVSFASAAVVDAKHVTVTYNVDVLGSSLVASSPLGVGSDFTVVSNSGTTSTANPVVAAVETSVGVVTLTLANNIPVGQFVVITSRLGSDGNTVGDTNVPVNYQAVGQSVQTSNVFATVPGAPTALTLGTPTSTTQPLTWTAGSNGGSAITGYTVTVYAGPVIAGSPAKTQTFTGPATSGTVTGLAPNTQYTYVIKATNSVGTGVNSSPATGSTTA